MHILVSYVAYIVEIIDDKSGIHENVILDVSREGKQFRISVPYTQFDFNIVLNQRIIVDVVCIDSLKKLVFQPFVNSELDEYETLLIDEFVNMIKYTKS